MYKILTSLIILGSFVFSGWMYPQIQQVKETQNEISFGAKNAVGGEVYYLSGSGLTSSATSIGLTKFGYTQPGGTYSKFSMPNFGDLGCATIQPGNTSGKQEFISFTGVSQNSDGTATLTGVTRGLERYTPFAASTTLQTAHAGGSDIVISNSPPCFYESYANLSQDEAVTGLWNFNSYLPTSSITATTSAQLTTKSYVDNLTNQGAATSTLTNGGIVELATQQEMASSTDSGDVEKPRVLWSAYSTSSPYTSGMWAPITDKDGKLNQTFWRLSQAFTWTGIHTWNTATSTFTISPIITAATSSPLKLNGVEWSFPSSDKASSTALFTNGNGSLSFLYPDWLLIGEATLASPNSTTTVSITSGFTDIKIIADVRGKSSADITELRFNNDGLTANNYGYLVFRDNVSTPDNQGNGKKYIAIEGTSTTSPAVFYIDVINNLSTRKIVNWQGGTSPSGTAIGSLYEGTGVWNNTSDGITSIQIITDSTSNTFNTGTTLRVYGAKR